MLGDTTAEGDPGPGPGSAQYADSAWIVDATSEQDAPVVLARGDNAVVWPRPNRRALPSNSAAASVATAGRGHLAGLDGRAGPARHPPGEMAERCGYRSSCRSDVFGVGGFGLAEAFGDLFGGLAGQDLWVIGRPDQHR